MMITCTRCRIAQDAANFYAQTTRGRTHTAWCKSCFRAHRAARRGAAAAPAMTVAQARAYAPQIWAQTFGVEIETQGLGIAAAADVMARTLGGTIETFQDYYHRTAYRVMVGGRGWVAMGDGSIGSVHDSAEIVTPILCGPADLALLQNVIRALRAAGAKSNPRTCGIHVHVGIDRTLVAADQLARLAQIVHANDAVIRAACAVTSARDHWCHRLGSDAVARLADAAARANLTSLQTAWYGDAYTTPAKSHRSRYHGLNLNSFFFRGTAEFRFFNGTMHAGKVRAYVQLALGLVALACRTADQIPSAWGVAHATRANAVALLDACGLAGDEFTTCRYHLLGRWDSGDDASAAAA